MFTRHGGSCMTGRYMCRAHGASDASTSPGILQRSLSRHAVIGSARHAVLPTARAVLCIARWCLDGNNAARGHLMATAATGALESSHGPPLQLLTRLHHSTGSGDHRRAASPWICLVMPHATAQIGRQRQGHAGGQEAGVSIAVGSCSRLEQSPQPPRSPQRGWPQRWRSEPARRRVKCRAIDT